MTNDEQLIEHYRHLSPVAQEQFVKASDPATLLVLALWEMTWDYTATGKYYIRLALKKLRQSSTVPVIGETSQGKNA